MPINPLGPGVSRYLNDRDRQYAAVIFQASKPPLDSEFNLISLIDLEAKAEEVRSRVPSGWLMDEANPNSDYFTNPSYSNQFYFGKNAPGENRNVTWAVVNGWPIPVTGTRTGSPPLAANNTDYWNRIALNPPSTSTGGNRAEFVFLEVWLQRIDVDPAPPTVAPGKPQRGFIYRFGNVEGGFSNLPDELVDPDINYETTKRVQIQYRIRVVADVSLVSNPEGFDSSLVLAQGALSAPSAVPFTNMRAELGDAGLWRAGTGDPVTFGTVDGYVYAIPICSVFRRNSAGFSDIGNLAGSFNRNSKALSRNDATSFTSPLLLQAPLSAVATSFSLTSILGTPLNTTNSFGEAYVRIDDEIVRVTSIVLVSPTNYTININRGQLNTIPRSHNSGTTMSLYTVRPDGLYADQIANTDIMDMRHSIADKFDYDSILRTNVLQLLKGNLRSTWKRWGTTNTAGSVVLYGDRITDSSIFVGGLTRLDAPDGNRRLFSDSAVTQRLVLPIEVPSNSAALTSFLQVSIPPYTATATWSAAAPGHAPGSRLVSGYPSWFNGDEITINLAPFQSGLPAGDAGQVRFVLPSEIADSVLVRFEGMTTDPNGGDRTATPATAPTSTDPNLALPIVGSRILKNGQGITVTLDLSGNLVITLASGTAGIEFQEFKDSIQGETNPARVTQYLMYVEFTVVYGTGRGLSHKPEWVHSVQYRGTPTNVTKTLTRTGLSTLSPMIPTYLGDSPYIQTGNNRQYARTSEVMIDPGSKTAYVAPYRVVEVAPLVCRDGSLLNWYGPLGASSQGMMPSLDQDGVNTVNQFVDPLNLFYKGGLSRYVEISPDYLPRPGLHHVPIIPVSNTVFSSGINFLVKSSSGPVSNSSDYNRNYVSYPANSPGYYIVTPQVGELYGDNSGLLSLFGEKVTVPQVPAGPNSVFRGIRLPPFMGPARITGIYLRNASAVVPTSSPFNNDRAYIGGLGTDTNLMRDSFDGPTYLLDVNVNGDVTFVLNADVIDLSKAPSGTTFDNSDFLIECTLFGFDRGFLQTNTRIAVCETLGSSIAQSVAGLPYEAANFSLSNVGFIVPAPISAGASNNEITFYYSRSPYQGDCFGTQNAYSDDLYRKGPLTGGESSLLFNTPLGPVPTLTLPNKTGYEVLASTQFVTSMGTGRLSGSGPIPLLNTFEAPNNPPDYVGTRVDLNRKLSTNRVGYEDWKTPRFPVDPSTIGSRPSIKTSALSEVFDYDLHPEMAGCISQLPLGAYFRDKDFVGKTLYQTRSNNGAAAVPVGTFTFTQYETPISKGTGGASTWEGRDFNCGMTGNVVGVGSEALVRVDGTANLGDNKVFKTTRGGAAFSVSGPWPGGDIASRFMKTRPNTEVGSVLLCSAFLVRSQPEFVSSQEIHPGNELQMVLVTQAAPAYFRDNEIVHSASGTNEGYTAVDRYRLMGKPIEKRKTMVNIDINVRPAPPALFVNKIYDNPLLYGSGDIPLISTKQETLPVITNGQTLFTLTEMPVDPSTVQMYVNGVKMQYGVDFTVAPNPSKDVTYYPNPPVRPPLITTDIVEFWYLLY